MLYSFNLPEEGHANGEFTSRKAIDEMVQALERNGIDACYLTDHPAPTEAWLKGGGHHTLDPFIGLSFAACAGDKIKLHTNLIVLPYRNPLMVAKSAAALDALSNGRLILGVGAGYLQGEFDALGCSMDNRGKRMEEAFEVMKLAWTGKPVTYTGSDFKADGNLVLPPPVQQPNPPIWVGGNSEAAMRRAAKYCEGWMPFPAKGAMSAATRTTELATVEDLARKIEQIKQYRKDAGRSGPFDIAMVPFGMDLRSHKRPTNAAIIDQLRQLKQIGVTWSVLTIPAKTRREYIDNVNWFTQEIKSAV
jgi:probable F420-dependent oxidoreductase